MAHIMTFVRSEDLAKALTDPSTKFPVITSLSVDQILVIWKDQVCERVIWKEPHTPLSPRDLDLLSFVAFDLEDNNVIIWPFTQNGKRPHSIGRKGFTIYSKEWVSTKHGPPVRLVFLETTTQRVKVTNPVNFISKHQNDQQKKSNELSYPLSPVISLDSVPPELKPVDWRAPHSTPPSEPSITGFECLDNNNGLRVDEFGDEEPF